MKFFIVLIISVLVLSGCATLTRSECLTADWYQIGYEDGSYGFPDTRIKAHRKACAQHGVTPDFEDFQKGHIEGVITFCTPKNGFIQGKRNSKYQSFCSQKLEASFLEAYNNGRQVYRANKDFQEAQAAQKENKQAIKSLRQEIQAKKAIMFATDTSTEARYALDAQVSPLQISLYLLEQQTEQLMIDVEYTEAKLQDVEETFSLLY